MKLYYHPVSTTCRPIMLLAHEAGIKLDYEMVDLFSGAQYKPEFTAMNPSHQVPLLVDGDFRLTESSAILKYLAEKHGSPTYPKDLQQRAHVNESMDWFNTSVGREFCYGFVYAQIFPFMRRPDDAVHAGTVAWHREKSLGWLKILDADLIGPSKRFLCGDAVTIADYFGSILVLNGEAIGASLAAYPNIRRWMDGMKALPSWKAVNEAFYQYLVEPNRGKSFVGL